MLEEQKICGESSLSCERSSRIQSLKPKISSQQLHFIFERCYKGKDSDEISPLNDSTAAEQHEKAVAVTQKDLNCSNQNAFPEEEIIFEDVSKFPESTTQLPIASIGDFQLITRQKEYLKSLFTRENIVRLFANEFNEKVIRLPKLFRGHYYDERTFQFHLDKDANAEFMFFVMSKKIVSHIKDVLSNLETESVYISSPNGTGKSYTIYFITCLLIGTNANYSEESDAGREEWQKIDGWQNFGKIPLYVSSYRGGNHTIHEILSFAYNFYDPEIENSFGELFSEFKSKKLTNYYSPEDVEAFTKFLKKRLGDCIILLDQDNYMVENMEEGPANRLLSSLSSRLRGIVSSSDYRRIRPLTEFEISKLKFVQFPMWQFSNKQLFEIFVVCLKKLHKSQFYKRDLIEEEKIYLKENIDEIIGHIPSNLHDLVFDVCHYSIDIQKEETPASTIQRVKKILYSLRNFKQEYFEMSDRQYEAFLKNLSPEQKEQNLECMRRVLYGLPLENIPRFYNKDFFYILEKDENSYSAQEYLVPIVSNFYNVIERHHRELVSQSQNDLYTLSSCGIKMPYVLRIMLEKSFIEHIKISKRIFLAKTISIEKVEPYRNAAPSNIELESNTLYYPTKTNYAIVDAILVRKESDLNVVSFIHISTIGPKGFSSKIEGIQRQLGIYKRNARKNDQNPMNQPHLEARADSTTQCNPIFIKWMKALIASGFKPETTKFEFWIICKGIHKFMKTDTFQESFQCLCFDDSMNYDGKFYEFLNCRTIQQYQKHYKSISK